MGLTHYAILNQLLDKAEFYFVDPDKKVNFLTRRNLNANVVNNDKGLEQSFDYALVCTPPMFHIPILNQLRKKGVPNIFVEKPFGSVKDDFSNFISCDEQIKIGYVLRFNPIVQWVKQFINIDSIVKVEGYYFSNTIERKPKGWRNSVYSGVTNEMGAHIIDLCIYLFGLSNPRLVNVQIDSVVSDVDDILIADLMENSIHYHLHFDWVNKSYRKPIFNFIITMKDGTSLKFDQQKCEYFRGDELINSVSSVDLAKGVQFYLRGIDFTSQMQDFIGHKETIATVSEGLISRNLIKLLLKK